MGINDIHILTDQEIDQKAAQVQATREAVLKADHRRGLHPWGSMRRDCPLCQAGK